MVLVLDEIHKEIAQGVARQIVGLAHFFAFHAHVVGHQFWDNRFEYAYDIAA